MMPPEQSRPTGPQPAPYDAADHGISLLQILSVVLRHRYTIAGMSLGVAFLVGLAGLRAPRSYTADGSFIPQAAERGGLGGAAQLAGQLGITLPGSGGTATESPEFYANLLGSREILGQMLLDTFSVSEGSRRNGDVRSGTLAELLEIDEEREELRRHRTIRWLQNSVSASTVRETGVVRLSVTTPWPNLSEALGHRLLDLVNDFNRRTRRTQAAAERTFIEERIVDAEERLLAAEDELKRFFETNRQFQNSPELVFEHERLQRQVAMRQQLFTALSQGYEDARISEVRNTPLITVVEPPEAPVHPDGRGLVLRVLLGLMLGGMLGVFVAFGRQMVVRGREDGDENFSEFHKVWEDTLNDFRWIRLRPRSTSNDDGGAPATSIHEGS